MKQPQPIYNWSFEKYIKFVENTSNSMLREYEDKELEYITTKIPDLKARTVIDIGAGYGRILPHLASLTKNIVAVEIDPNMFSELKRRTIEYPNVTAIQRDANYLCKLLKGVKLTKPVILSLQNSFGTWEGDYKKALKEMIKIAKEYKGEVVISLLIQEGLKKYGIDIYQSVSKLVGEPDLEKTNFEKGIFRSKTGYYSKWRTDNEINKIIKQLGSKEIKKVENPNFVILHAIY